MKMHLLIAAALAAAAGTAQAATVDFEATPSGNYGTLTVGDITFGSALGGVSVGNYGVQGDGQSIGAFDDTNGNYLTGTFASSATALSLTFGNDDANFTVPGDLATLQVFLGATLVGQSTVVLNRDDVMNQSISYAGGTFDNFTFAYTDAAGSPFTGGNGTSIGLIEIADNFTYTLAGVPEPATWAMMIGGMGLVGGTLRRRRGTGATLAHA